MPRLVTLALIIGFIVSSAIMAVVIWTVGRWMGAQRTPLLLIIGAGVLGHGVIFLLLGQFLENSVFRPLISVIRETETALRQEGRPEFQITESAKLGPIASDLSKLARKFLSSHRATHAAVNDAVTRAEDQRRRLESILHDLSEGVIVCNLEHQLLLYNRVALWLFSGAGEIGIGRSVEGLMGMGPVEKALQTLLNASIGSGEHHGDESTVSLPCRLLNGSGVLSSRMSLTYDGEGRADGYVLTLSAESDPLDPAAPSARETFYDFDLFHRPLNSGFNNDATLRDFGYVVFDSETTGLRPSDGDTFVSLAAVRVVNGRVLQTEIFDSLINPGRPIPPAATRVHGITDAAVVNAPDAEQVLRRFQQFSANAILVAHNAAFDMRFLETAGAETDIRFDNPIFDTMLLSIGLHDHAVGHTLESVADRFGVDITPGQRHTALGDALVTAEIFVRQLGMLEGRGIHTLADAIAFQEKQNNRRRQSRY